MVDKNKLVNLEDLKIVSDILKSTQEEVSRAPIVYDTDASGVDLDIADEDGHVAARLQDGGIRTKFFRSDAVPRVKSSNASNTDLDLCDSRGNVGARFSGGHIRTRNFDSEQIINGITKMWAGKKWAAIGDSLTEHNIRANKNYDEYISERTGITVVNLGHSGAGYYYRNSDFTFRLRALEVPLNADVVTIFGSGNDLDKGVPLGEVTDTEATSLCGCMNITFENLYTRVPLVPIGVITPTPWYLGASKNWTPANPGNIMEQYCGALIEICRRRGIPCLDLYHCSNLRPQDATYRAGMYSRDEGNGVHPDENGQKLIAAAIQTLLEKILLH